jgi:Animal haem peroxidase
MSSSATRTRERSIVTFGEHVSPSELLQARSPSLDLDSLYGAGPQDSDSAKFYAADGLHLKMGKTVAVATDAAMDGFDLPRGTGSTAAEKREAIIPDPRNDENLAVAQTHLAFIRFHNRVVDTLPAATPQSLRFAAARELVTKHYQWMIRTDYLPRICAPGVVSNVFASGRKAFEPTAPPTEVPTMPIEFSVAAFRLGHSMKRTSSSLRAGRLCATLRSALHRSAPSRLPPTSARPMAPITQAPTHRRRKPADSVQLTIASRTSMRGMAMWCNARTGPGASRAAFRARVPGMAESGDHSRDGAAASVSARYPRHPDARGVFCFLARCGGGDTPIVQSSTSASKGAQGAFHALNAKLNRWRIDKGIADAAGF